MCTVAKICMYVQAKPKSSKYNPAESTFRLVSGFEADPAQSPQFLYLLCWQKSPLLTAQKYEALLAQSSQLWRDKQPFLKTQKYAAKQRPISKILNNFVLWWEKSCVAFFLHFSSLILTLLTLLPCVMINPIMPHDSCDHCDPIMHHDESYHAIIVECSLVMIPVLHANRPSDAILPVLLAPKDQMIRW